MLKSTGLAPALVALAVMLLSGVAKAEPPPTASLTLAQALKVSRENSELRAAAVLRIGEARGDLTQASVLLVDNPELSFEGGQRLATPDTDGVVEFSVGVEQTFAFGRRKHRVASARSRVEASTAGADDVQRVLDHAVAATFYSALASEQRLQFVERNEALARELFDVARRRLEIGVGTPLHLNTARVRVATAQRETVRARAEKRGAIVRLAELLGLPPAGKLSVLGDLPGLSDIEPAPQLIASARAARPDLASAAHDIDAARAAVGLADAEAWPEIGLGASYGQDDARDILLATLRVAIPLFNRNQGGRQAARATYERLVAERDALVQAADAEIQQALVAYDEARQAVEIYDTAVLRAQEESLAMLTRALEVGEVGIGEVIIMQREIASGNQGYLEARLELAHARAALLAAAGLPQTEQITGATP